MVDGADALTWRAGRASSEAMRDCSAVMYVHMYVSAVPVMTLLLVTVPPAVTATLVHGDNTVLGVTPSLRMSSVSESSFDAVLYTHTGTLPNQIKWGFDVVAVGVPAQTS